MQNQTEQELEPQLEEEYVSGQDYREELRALQPEQPQEITWKHRLAVIFLIIFAGVAIILWAIQFTNNLQVTKPLSEEEIAEIQKQQEAEQISRTQDTDGDGLVDYDELNFYGTSPYLEDTDSDGIDDKREIDLGEDPNCPRGQECFNSNSDGEASATDESASATGQQFTAEQLAELERLLGEGDGASSNEISSDNQEIESVLTGRADAASLRALLDQFGMDKDTLDKISDEDLMRIYGETLSN